MEVLNRAFNIAGDLIDSFCPSGIKAGELGPNSGFMLYVLGGDTLAGVTLVSGMMAGYTFKAVQGLVLNQRPHILITCLTGSLWGLIRSQIWVVI